MPHGCRTRRTLSMFAGTLIALTVTVASGCQRLAVSRALPLPLAPNSPATTSASAPQARSTPGALVESGAETPPAPPPSSASIIPSTAGEHPLPATPMLDAASRRARAEVTMPTLTEHDVAPSTAVGETQPLAPPGMDPTTEAESPERPDSAPDTEPGSSPRVVLAGLTPGAPAAGPKADPTVESSATLVPDRVEDPKAAPRPINPERAIAAPKPREGWHETVERLRTVARDRASEPEGDTHGLWSLRTRLLGWLDDAASAADSEEGAFRRSVLTALAVTTGPETPDTTVQAATIHAAVEALEARSPLEITELQVCRKVRGFGDFEPLEASACRPGHGVIVYCELAGLRYESEGSLHRSRLESRVEVAPSGVAEPIWSQSLGTADDLCRRCRRDYYVNYRMTLPESLAPGDYELRLIQTDLISHHSATRSVAVTIQP
jgi:hypothetical protein